MERLWKEQRGSALLLVVFIIMVFMMLGLAIIGATLGGAKRSMTRESDVQSLHLAERALNEAAARIAVKFDGKDSINLEQLDQDLLDIKNQVNNWAATESDLAGSADGRIIGFDVLPAGSGQDVKTKDITITVKAQADVNGVTRILAQDITLSSYPEFLKYAFGSESQVYINGAPFIIGDFYSGMQLWAKNQANYRYNLPDEDPDQHAPTQFPTIEGTVYVQDEKSIQACTSYPGDGPCVNYSPVKMDDSDGGQGLLSTLHTTLDQVQYRNREKFVSVNVEESFLDKLAEAAGDTKEGRDLYPKLTDLQPDSGDPDGPASGIASAQIRQLEGSMTLAPMKPSPPPEPTDEQLEKYLDDLAAYQSFFNNGMLNGSAVYDGDLTLDGYELQGLNYNSSAKEDRHANGDFMKSNWFIVNGNLTISNSKDEPLNVLGNILVNGNVTIRGKVNMDATVISLGETTIEDAEIMGMNVGGVEKELLLISKGRIFINRVKSFNPVSSSFDPEAAQQAPNSPEVLKAFFYTDSDAELYGVGSAFWIRGGFFSKGDMVINAVLGNTVRNGSDSDLVPDQLLNQTLLQPGEESRQERLQSRFIIQYDDQIYDNQNVGLPRVKTINITVGKKHFVDGENE